MEVNGKYPIGVLNKNDKKSYRYISTLQTLADRYTIHMQVQLISSLSCLVSCVHQFLPEASFGLRVLSLPASVCVCVRPCVNHQLGHAITHHPFKLGSPNLDHICKRPWLRSLLFWGMMMTLTFKVKFNFKVKIYPILSLSMP